MIILNEIVLAIWLMIKGFRVKERCIPPKTASGKLMEELVNFQNSNVSLEGTLYKPESGVPYPLVIAAHVSGEGCRDSDIFMHLRETFPEIGIGVFLYDRRGSGKSNGDFEKASFHDLAEDLVAAVEYLKIRSDVDSGKIALWGLSQGGWIAPLAASLCSNISLLIAISSSGKTPAEQMTYSAKYRMMEKGFSKQEMEIMENLHRDVNQFYRGNLKHAETLDKLNEYKHQTWFSMSYLECDLPDYPQKTKWYQEMDYDPCPVMKNLNIPVLLIYGERDPWIDIQGSIEIWRTMGPIDSSIHQIQDANHFMKSISSSGLEGSSGSHPEEYLDILTSWIREHFYI